MKLNSKNALIKKLDEKDVQIFQKIIELFVHVFETDKYEAPGKAHLEKLLQDSKFIVFVVMYGNEIAGGLTAYELVNYYSEGSEIFIYDIAIKPEFQRQGLGKKLILTVNEYCSENGIGEFFVEAHEEDSDAVDFYNTTGGKSEKVIQFSYTINK